MYFRYNFFLYIHILKRHRHHTRYIYIHPSMMMQSFYHKSGEKVQKSTFLYIHTQDDESERRE